MLTENLVSIGFVKFCDYLQRYARRRKVVKSALCWKLVSLCPQLQHPSKYVCVTAKVTRLDYAAGSIFKNPSGKYGRPEGGLMMTSSS